MQVMDTVAWVHLCILLLIVPTQYLVVWYNGSTESQRSTAIYRFIHKIGQLKEDYLSFNKWNNWYFHMWADTYFRAEAPDFVDPKYDKGESPAKEVLEMNSPHGYFATSTDVRSLRPSHLTYRIGQVIKHKVWGYRGVIIGWDLQAKAPDSWLNEMHPKDKPHWRTQPNYSVLVDTRDRLAPQITYVPQENIETITNTQVIHPQLENYFEIFDGAQYIARPWLKSVYPHD